MSKRLHYYPEPTKIINEFGADALRLYLIDSPVVRAESLKFSEKGVKNVIKDVFLPWYNAYRFFVMNALSYGTRVGKDFVPLELTPDKVTNVMDRWILAATQSLIVFVAEEMGAYRLYTVVPRLVKFIEQLTNW